MKKIIPVILVTFLSFSLLYACGGSTESLVKPTVVSSPPVNQSNVKIQKIPTSSPSVYSGASTSTITRPNVTANQSSKPTAVPGAALPTTAGNVSVPVTSTPTPEVRINKPTSVAKVEVQTPAIPTQTPAIATQTPVIQPPKPVLPASFEEPDFRPLVGYGTFNEDQILGFSRVLNEEFDSIYEKIGISASVYQAGKIWSDGLGFSEYLLPMEGHTPVGIKSVSKTFLAALILTQIEEGLYGLDDGISELLSGHDGYDSLDKSVIPDVTVRELLTMTSGIATSESNQTQEAMEVMAGPTWEPSATLKLIKRAAKTPGNFEYSPIANSFLLAMVAEYKTGENLYSLYRSALLNPLSIDAILMPAMVAPDSIAHPYGLREYYGGSGGFGDLEKIPAWTKASCPQCFDDFTFINADARLAWSGAGIVTNSQNLSRWGYELFSMNGHAISEPAREILLDSFSDEVVQFTGPHPRYGFHVTQYKFVLVDGTELVAYGHPGGGSGTSSALFYVPDLDLSISILANSELGSLPGNCKSDRESELSSLDCVALGFMEVISGVFGEAVNEDSAAKSASNENLGTTDILAAVKGIAVNNFIDLDPYISISKLRAAYGHDYSFSDEEYDPSGQSCRSMKHYFDAFTYEQRNSENFGAYDPKGIVKYYAPADGLLMDVNPNQFSATETEYRFTIMSDENPNLFFTFMHVDLLDELRSGASVKAGQHLGYIIRPHGQGEIATWIYSGNSELKYISFFEVASDEVFAEYTARGAGERSDFIITREERDNNPIPCDRNDNSGSKFKPVGDPEAFNEWQSGSDNWVFLNP